MRSSRLALLGLVAVALAASGLSYLQHAGDGPLAWSVAWSAIWPVGCRRAPNPASPGWDQLPAIETTAHPLGTHLRGRVVGLDPGHGGDRDAAKQVEARANLRVSLALRDFLERDGARVVLTRTQDHEVPLAERAPRLAQAGAEVMVSIHHNAAASLEPNYTSTWYHGDGDRCPASLDLAWPVQRRVMELLRTPVTVPTPLLSDHLQFPRAGFQVLRSAQIPAVLCEGSFYTNPAEAQRLEDANYLEREAYAYYLGLVEYFAGGTPSTRWVSSSPTGDGGLRVTVELTDGLAGRGGWGDDRLRILVSTITVLVDDQLVAHSLDRASGHLTFVVVARLSQRVELRFQNIFKHHNHPTAFRLTDDPTPKLAPQ